MSEQKKSAFEEAAAEQAPGLLGEFLALLKHNKKYWMLPIILVLLLFGVLMVLSGSAAAPFIYPLF